MEKIIAYHGTSKRFEQFDSSYLGTTTSSICQGNGNLVGFYFTDDLEAAKAYSREAGCNEGEEIILTCELSFSSLWDGTSSEVEQIEDADEFRGFMDADGYDALRLWNRDYTEYCIWNVEQIKICS